MNPPILHSLNGGHAIRHNEKGDVMLGAWVPLDSPLREGCVLASCRRADCAGPGLARDGAGSLHSHSGLVRHSGPSVRDRHPVECLRFPLLTLAMYRARETRSTCLGVINCDGLPSDDAWRGGREASGSTETRKGAFECQNLSPGKQEGRQPLALCF